MVIIKIDDDFLEDLVAKALKSDRRRATENKTTTNCNLQALYTAMTRTSYVRPHKHPVCEIIIPIRGKILVVEYNDDSSIAERHYLGERYSTREVLIQPYTWHNLVALTPIAIISNPVEGPYKKEKTEFLEKTPEENTPEALQFLFDLLKIGQ